MGGTLPVGLTRGEEGATPTGLSHGGRRVTLGSACGTTQGYRPESRWDSPFCSNSRGTARCVYGR